MKTANICKLARTIRSKNAGYFAVTVEIIFDSRQNYELVKASGAVSAETIARAFNVAAERVANFHYFDPGLGIKANFLKDVASGGPGETDVYGCQQYAPLLTIEVPLGDSDK
jgi:hypothetical protein